LDWAALQKRVAVAHDVNMMAKYGVDHRSGISEAQDRKMRDRNSISYFSVPHFSVLRPK
jgi:hypothetical protein